MRKSTIAAIAAAAVVGFGAVGSASADMEWQGFADVNWAMFSAGEEAGHFGGSGELDFTQQTDGIMLRTDLDLNNCDNSSPGADLLTGTNPSADPPLAVDAECGVGVDIEQLYVTIPVNDMISATAGIQNSKHGLEGQDATDINFAANGLLWTFVPSNVVGLSVTATPTEMVTVWAALINTWTDAGQFTDTANDWMAGFSLMPMDGVVINASYLTDETEGATALAGATQANGDEFDINAILNLIQDVEVSLEYLLADPASGSFGFDSGYGVNAAYTLDDITVAGRYEAATFEGTGSDVTTGSVAASYALGPQTVVRVDYTSTNIDDFETDDTVTLQLIHQVGGAT